MKLYEKLGVKKENYSLLSTVYYSFFISGMISVILGALLPYLRSEYALDYTVSGVLLSFHQFGNLGAVILSGFLPYALGRKTSTLMLGSGLVIGVLLMTFTGQPAWLMLAFAFIGIGRGTWSNICNTTTGETVENKAAGMNILHASFAIGALLGPVILFLCNNVFDIGWKWTARLLGALALIALIAVAVSKISGRRTAKNVQSGKENPLSIIKSKSFLLATGVLFFYVGVEASIIGWFVTYFSETGILSPTIAGFAPTIIWFTVMLGRFFTAANAQKWRSKQKSVFIMGFGVCLFFIIMFLSKNSVASVICLFGLGFSMAGIYATTLSTIKDLSSTLVNGLCIGIATMGAILSPILVGKVADSYGINAGIGTILIFAVCMLATMALSIHYSKKDSAKTV